MERVVDALAPVSGQALDEALRPFGESRMLPAEAYTSDAVLAWERRHLFAGSWMCLGRTGQLRDAGRQCGRRAGDVGVVLTFGDDGTVRAFANTCRHRAHELVPDGESIDRPALVCPYHGWAYGLDGRLRTAPRMAADFDRADHGLVELPAVDWHGWLLINATGDAVPLREHLGSLDDHVAPYRPERLVVKASHRHQVAANWKLIVENYHQCYHCPSIHPELCVVTPPNSGENWREPGAWAGGSMRLRDFAQTMSLDGVSHGVPLSDVDPRTVNYLGLFPNLLVSLHPDYVLTHRLTPTGPGSTVVECEWLFDETVTDPSYAVRFWDITNREDWAACESVQRGVESPHYRAGPLAPNENAVYDWVRMVARAYRGLPPSTMD